MRKTFAVSFGISAALALTLTAVAAPAASALMLQDPQQPMAAASVVPFTADQLDNLVAPVALYPDPLLAQVLLAATFPDQISDAEQYVRANGTNGIDEQYWDVSVKAVAHYPTVLNMMNSQLDWTTSLGQAYAQQSTDVMQAVQHMRELAQAQGNLESTPQQQVVADAGYIRIWPAQPQYMYVPVYDPSVIYCQPVFGQPGFGAYFSFGVGYPIGSWLIYDWDWPSWRIVYTSWDGDGWRRRSRPYIRMSGVYINAGYRNVRYGHDVIYRHPDYGHIRVYSGIGAHRVDYVNHMDHNAGRYAVPRDGHGVVTAGSGYRQQPRQGQADPHVRVMPQNGPGARRMPASSAPSQAWTRSAQPRYVAPRSEPSPAVNWKRGGSTYYGPQQRPARAQPRYAAPRSEPGAQPRYVAPRSEPTAQPRYSAPPRVEPRYTAPARAEPRYNAPRYSAPRAQPSYSAPRAEPRYSAPRAEPRYSAPQPQARSAPSGGYSRPSGHAESRSAHPRGGHGRN
ncbi:MAG TPA: DUF3300 domain-containing protein [Gemmatimonadaceae bacterium]